MPALLAVALIVALACAPAAADVGGPIHLKSSGAVEMGMKSGRRVMQFTDSVVFEYGGYRMTTDRLTVDETEQRAWADGEVFLSGPAGWARASRIWFEMATDRAVLEDMEARMGPWSARARRAEISGTRIDMYDAVMSACPGAHPIYSLHARHLSKESPERYVARGVVPYFYVVPVFYLPRYTYELEREEEGDTLVPSRQGFELNPGRGKYTGVFLKTAFRKKWFNRKLLTTTHIDYYGKPGPAIGEEIQYRSRSADYYAFTYFVRQRKISRESHSAVGGHENRFRLWNTWTKKYDRGHFKAFVNEVSDSQMEDDYRLRLDERRLQEREVAIEAVLDRSPARFKIEGSRRMTLDTDGPKEYRLEHRVWPAIRFLTFPFALAGSSPGAPVQAAFKGWRLYGLADAWAGHGRDRFDRDDGAMGDARIGSVLNVPLTHRLAASMQMAIEGRFRDKTAGTENSSATPIGQARVALHRPWLREWLQTDAGYSYRRAWENRDEFGPDGYIEDHLFWSLRSFHRVWKVSFDNGYDLRPGYRHLSLVDFQLRRDGPISRLSTTVRYDPKVHHAQSVHAAANFRFTPRVDWGIGFQSVHIDSDVTLQFTPVANFETSDRVYRFGMSGLYDAKDVRWMTKEFYVIRAFKCIETSLRISKTDQDLQFNLSFRLTGFRHVDEVFSSPGSF